MSRWSSDDIRSSIVIFSGCALVFTVPIGLATGWWVVPVVTVPFVAAVCMVVYWLYDWITETDARVFGAKVIGWC